VNILVLIGIILALSGFKPVSTEKGQATQGYYQPSPSKPKLKMNTTANLGDIQNSGNWRGVEHNTYFRADSTSPSTGEVRDFVYRKHGWGGAQSTGFWDPMKYTTENDT